MAASGLQERLLRLCKANPTLRRDLRQALHRVASIDDDYLTWEALQKISDRAPLILMILREHGNDLEPWQEEMLHLAAEAVDAVYDSLSDGLE